MSDQRTVPHRFSGIPVRSLKVEVKEGPDADKKVVANSDSISIGSADGNDLVLTDETVSRYHIELVRKQDRIFIRDMGSTNGIKLGSTFIESASIAPGTTLQIGRTTIRVDDGETVDIELHGEDRLGPVRGRTPEMRTLMARLQRAAKTDVSVLLLGETGVGKEVIARAVHESSPRAQNPFEVVDCGALMPTLIASELFGHEKGAFTGADRQHVGAFERADGGTLFLDEIGELPPPLQSALLGALERRSFRRVGGTTPIKVDVRVVCATNRDLRSEVNAGSFRQDLYYRIAVILLRIPPLRERSGDIPLLVEHFLNEIGHQGPVEEIVPDQVLQTLKQHHWPGNVRELRNFVEAALAMGEAPHLEERLEKPTDGEGILTASATQMLVSLSYKDARNAVLEEFETIYLNDLMERTKHNVSAASREAKMNRSYLIQMLKRHGIR